MTLVTLVEDSLDCVQRLWAGILSAHNSLLLECHSTCGFYGALFSTLGAVVLLRTVTMLRAQVRSHVDVPVFQYVSEKWIDI